MIGQVLQRILEKASATTAAGCWSFLKPVISVRNLAGVDSTLIDGLSKEFTQQQLEAARVLVRGEDGQVVLSRVLGGDSGLFLRPSKDEAPLDLVNQHGSLSSDDPPAFGCLGDWVTRHNSRNTKCIFLAFSMADLLILRMLGLPCTSASGLETIDGDQIRRLFAHLLPPPNGPSSTASARASAQRPREAMIAGDYRLVLAGWSIAELKEQCPSEVRSVAERLGRAEQAYRLDSRPRVSVWQPTADELSSIRLAAELKDRDLACRLFWESGHRSIRSVRQFCEAERYDRDDYAAARRKLLRAVAKARETGFQHPEAAKHFQAFNRSFGTNFVEAILGDALSTADPIDRALLLAASELISHLHESSPLVRSTKDRSSGQYHLRDATLHRDDLTESLRVAEGLVKIHRELMRDK